MITLLALAAAASLATSCDSDAPSTHDAARSGLSGDSEVIIEVDFDGCYLLANDSTVLQSFLLPHATSVDAIELWIAPNLFIPTHMRVELSTGDGPGGSLIATSERVDQPPRVSDGIAEWQTFTFLDAPLLQPGTYTLRLIHESDETGSHGSCLDPYPDGTSYTHKENPTLDRDMAFRVLGNICGAVEQLGDVPLDCGPDLLLWLDGADRAQTLANSEPAVDGQEIDEWRDKSGHDHHAIAYAPSKKAELDTSAFGGRPAVRFEQDFMEIRDLDLRPSTHQAITAFAVVRRLGGYPNIWVAQENGFNKRSHIPTGAAVGTRVVSSLVLEGSPDDRRRHWLAGDGQVTDETMTYTEGSAGVGLGMLLYAWDGYAGTYAVDYELAELVIFDGVMAESDRAEIEQHLVDKWATDIEECPNPAPWPLPDPPADDWPHFVDTSYIALEDIGWISKYRSTIGFDYSDDFEHCRAMKHYHHPLDEVDWATVEIRSPIAGEVIAVEEEMFGTRVQIRSTEHPELDFLLWHIELASPLAVGAMLLEGEVLGTHYGSDTYSGIAVSTEVDGQRRLLSWFDVISDDLLAEFQARGGITSRADAIISQAERDHELLCCTNGEFDGDEDLADWVELDGGANAGAPAPLVSGLAAPLEGPAAQLGFR
ncbi:hypothetical protein DB30_02728 [Enhygromyxa salina]|uniref:Uncharacterized protein n=2 Tax=Enhygromyxa salina TaxID=215803 RepID=A0A0C2DIF1_9BACT|nr:hypothetical protein DB30_02728 [Enhygromyxa salina]